VSLLTDFPDFATAVALWQSPAASGGTVAAMTNRGTVQVVLTGIGAGEYALPPALLAGGRVEYMAFYDGTALIRQGDELRHGTVTRYAVQGTVDCGDLGIAYALERLPV